MKTLFKPIIASSLAVSFACTEIIQDITNSTTIDKVSADFNPSNEGISIKIPDTITTPSIISFSQDLTFSSNTSANGIIYGIRNHSQTTNDITLTTTSLQTPKTIKFTNLTSSGDNKSFVLSNEGRSALIFNQISILAGEKSSNFTASYGIYNALDRAQYYFGESGRNYPQAGSVFQITSNNQAIGIVVAGNMDVSGNLLQQITAPTKAVAIEAEKEKTLALRGASLQFNMTSAKSYGLLVQGTNIDNSTFTISGKLNASLGAKVPLLGENIFSFTSSQDLHVISLNNTHLIINPNIKLSFNAESEDGNLIALGNQANSKAKISGNLFVSSLRAKQDFTIYAIKNEGVLTFASDASLTIGNLPSGFEGTYGIFSDNARSVFDFGTNGVIFENIQNHNNENASGIVLNKDATFQGNLTQTITAKNKGTAEGLRLNSSLTLYLENTNLNFKLIANQGQAYGLKTNINQSITLNGNGKIQVSSITSNQGYILYNNKQSSGIRFLGVSLVSGELTEADNTYGIYNNLANANYFFGCNTNFIINGEEAKGIILAKDANFQGQLSQTIKSTQKAFALTNTATSSLYFLSDDTAIPNTLSFNLTGKEIYGIHVTSGTTFTLNKGTIQIAPNQTQNLSVIKNEGTNLTFNHSSLIAGSGSDASSFGLYHKLDGGNYHFGTLTHFVISNTQGDAKGIILEGNATFNGTLTQKITLSQESEKATGVAYGIYVQGNSSLNIVSNNSATLTINAPLKAIGLHLNDSFALNNQGSLKLKIGEAATQEAIAISLANQGSLEVSKLVFDGTNEGIYGIKTIGISNQASQATRISGEFVFQNNALKGSNEKIAIQSNSSHKLTFARNSSISTLTTALYRTLGQTGYGIYNDIDDMKYDFGLETNFENIASKEAGSIGVILGNNTHISGKLVQNLSSTTKNIALSPTKDLVLTLSGGSLSFNTSANGENYGIHSEHNLTIKGKGNITLNPSASASLIHNASTNKTITFGENGNIQKSQVSFIAGSPIGEVGNTSTFGLSHSLNGHSYFFGTQTAKTVFCIQSQNNNAYGVLLRGETTFGGNLEQHIKSGLNSLAISGKEKHAYGIYVTQSPAPSILYLSEGNSTTLNITGAKRDGNTTGITSIQGDATGIFIRSNFTLAQDKGVDNSPTPLNGTPLKLILDGGESHVIYVDSIQDKQNQPLRLKINLESLNLATGSKIQATGDAMGIKNVGLSILQGSLTFGKNNGSALIQSTRGNAYGIHNLGDLTIDGKIAFEGGALQSNAGETYIIKNDGKLTLANGKLLSLANLSPKLDISFDYRIYNNVSGSKFDLGDGKLQLESSKNAYAIYNKGNEITESGNFAFGDFTLEAKGTQAIAFFAKNSTINLLVHANKTLTISTQSQNNNEGIAFGNESEGLINLDLGHSEDAGFIGGSVVFDSQAGSLNVLRGQNGKILLSGKNKTSRLSRYNGDSFRVRTLTIKDLQTSNTDFVLYADKKTQVIDGLNSPTGKAWTSKTKRSNVGGSDALIIKGSTTGTSIKPINNTLHIALNDISNTPRNVILAMVEKGATEGDSALSSKVIFNNLRRSNQGALIQSYVGFDIATLEIKRYDLTPEEGIENFKDIATIYYSNLVAKDLRINESYIAPTTSALYSNFYVLSSSFNSLNKRLGDLRENPKQNGLWARVLAGKTNSKFANPTQTTYIATQAGYDHSIQLSDGGKNHIGFALSYTYGESTQKESQYILNAFKEIQTFVNTATTHSAGGAIYNSYLGNSGFYSDTIAQFSYLTSSLNLKTSNATLDNYSFGLSQEIGYHAKLGDNQSWIIDPQIEISYAFMNKGKFDQIQSDGHTLSSTMDALNLLRTRAGINWGYSFNYLGKENNIKSSLYIGTYYEFDYITGGDIHLSSSNGAKTSFNHLSSNGRAIINVGTNINIKDHTQLYLDFEKSFGNKMQKEYQINFGLRFSFGSKQITQNEQPAEESKTTPLKLQDNQENTENS